MVPTHNCSKDYDTIQADINTKCHFLLNNPITAIQTNYAIITFIHIPYCLHHRNHYFDY